MYLLVNVVLITVKTGKELITSVKFCHYHFIIIFLINI